VEVIRAVTLGGEVLYTMQHCCTRAERLRYALVECQAAPEPYGISATDPEFDGCDGYGIVAFLPR